MIVDEHLAFFGEEAGVNMEDLKLKNWHAGIKEFLIFFPEMKSVWFYTIKRAATEAGCLYMDLRRLLWKYCAEELR